MIYKKKSICDIPLVIHNAKIKFIFENAKTIFEKNNSIVLNNQLFCVFL